MNIIFKIAPKDIDYIHDKGLTFDDPIEIKYKDVSHLPKKGDFIEFYCEILEQKIGKLLAEGICYSGLFSVSSLSHSYDLDYVEIWLDQA